MPLALTLTCTSIRRISSTDLSHGVRPSRDIRSGACCQGVSDRNSFGSNVQSVMACPGLIGLTEAEGRMSTPPLKSLVEGGPPDLSTSNSNSAAYWCLDHVGTLAHLGDVER